MAEIKGSATLSLDGGTMGAGTKNELKLEVKTGEGFNMQTLTELKAGFPQDDLQTGLVTGIYKPGDVKLPLLKEIILGYKGPHFSVFGGVADWERRYGRRLDAEGLKISHELLTSRSSGPFIERIGVRTDPGPAPGFALQGMWEPDKKDGGVGGRIYFYVSDASKGDGFLGMTSVLDKAGKRETDFFISGYKDDPFWSGVVAGFGGGVGYVKKDGYPFSIALDGGLAIMKAPVDLSDPVSVNPHLALGMDFPKLFVDDSKWFNHLALGLAFSSKNFPEKTDLDQWGTQFVGSIVVYEDKDGVPWNLQFVHALHYVNVPKGVSTGDDGQIETINEGNTAVVGPSNESIPQVTSLNGQEGLGYTAGLRAEINADDKNKVVLFLNVGTQDSTGKDLPVPVAAGMMYSMSF